MITIEDAKAALANYGLTVDDDILACYVEIVNEVEQCLIDAGLSECKIKVILTNLLLLQVWSAGTRVIKSTGGASGSSVSFEYDKEIYDKLVNQIQLFDTTGCTASLIPPDPSSPQAYFDVVEGLV